MLMPADNGGAAAGGRFEVEFAEIVQNANARTFHLDRARGRQRIIPVDIPSDRENRSQAR